MDNRARALSEGHPLRRWLVIMLVLAALVGVVWFAVHLVHTAKPAGPPGAGGSGPGGGFGGFGGGRRRPTTTVGVATAAPADIPITIEALGAVTPAATVTVTPQVSGVITQILFKEGQAVKKGQGLAVIDPRPLQNALLQAQGNLARDQAQLTNAELLLKRNQTLLAEDSIARQDVDTQSALVGQLKGTVMSDKAAVDSARLNLGYSKVVSPIAGRVGLRVIDLGNYIQAGSATGIAVVTEVTPIDVQFTIPQDSVPQLQQMSARSKLAVVAYDRTKTVVLDTGVFSTLDNQVDPTTGTVKAKARFPNATGALFPSQFVNVRLDLRTLRNTVVVPVSAVRTGPDGDFVWILNPDKTVTKRKVVRGPGTPTITAITFGLQFGEKVITEGGDRLTEGARVTLPTDRPSPMIACMADLKKLCGGKQGRDAFMCLRDNKAKASPTCQAALNAPRDPGGDGGSTPSPEMQAMRKTCEPDMKKLCPGQESREAMMCLRQNSAKAGKACQAALSKMPGRGGGGQGGAPSGGVPASGGPPAAEAPAGGAGGGGAFTPTPEMMAARAAMMKACGGDMKALCAGKEGREMFMCLRENTDKTSPSCQDAMSKMRRPQPAGG